RCDASRRQASAAMTKAASSSSQNAAVNHAGCVRKCAAAYSELGPMTGAPPWMPASLPPVGWSRHAAGRYNAFRAPKGDVMAAHEDPSRIVLPKDYDAPSVFRPENLLREARRQRGLAEAPVPAVCVLDPDGDI